MKKYIVFILVTLMLSATVAAYGGVGAGILVPIKQKEHYNVFKHNFENVSGYTFMCGSYNDAVKIKNHLFVTKTCPDKYPIVQMDAQIVTDKKASVEVYVFKSLKKMKIMGHESVLTMMLRTKPVQEGDFEIQVKLPRNTKYKAYSGKNLNKWTEMAELEFVRRQGDDDVYKVKFDQVVKYISIVKR